MDKPIVDFSIVKPEKQSSGDEKVDHKMEKMNEDIKRPETLAGETYKIKPPQAEHALYVTINDIVLNQGTEHETRRPFEIFLSSKNMEHFQWTVALTLIISAVFRKGGDITFLVEELRSVFDPNGGYLKKGGKYIPSLVSEIGDVIERHLQKIGMLDQHEPLIQASKSANEQTASDSQFPGDAQLCGQCRMKAVVKLDGCNTCLNCGYSKCG